MKNHRYYKLNLYIPYIIYYKKLPCKILTLKYALLSNICLRGSMFECFFLFKLKNVKKCLKYQLRANEKKKCLHK